MAHTVYLSLYRRYLLGNCTKRSYFMCPLWA